MIKYSKWNLNNGLRVIFYKPTDRTQATVNILYNVGARDESPERTGFAHLFEHLMFSGSAHIESYDTAVENAGGSNNAYTTNASALNKRIMSMVIERIKDQVQLFEKSEKQAAISA